MRSMWKGSLGFSLVMIPVSLYAATESKDVEFRQVHKTDGGRIRQRRICSIDGEAIDYADVAKGYELPTGEMIVLTDEDLEDLPLTTMKVIDVQHFSPAAQIDPMLYDKHYYIEPASGGEKAYVLTSQVLNEIGQVGVCKVALRAGRERLAILRPSDDGVLALTTLKWPDEVRRPMFPFMDNVEQLAPRSQELAMATSLVQTMTADFNPEAQTDGYREALIALVDSKVDGKPLPPRPDKPRPPERSLLDTLQASIDAAKPAPKRVTRKRKTA